MEPDLHVALYNSGKGKSSQKTQLQAVFMEKTIVFMEKGIFYSIVHGPVSWGTWLDSEVHSQEEKREGQEKKVWDRAIWMDLLEWT